MKIDKLTKPEKDPIVPLNAIERFLWWKKHYYMTLSILISSLVIPLFTYRRGNIILGIRISIIFYALIIIFLFTTKKITTEKDNIFLKNNNLHVVPPKTWWRTTIKYLFILLRVYIIYLLITTWMMTYG